MRWSILKTNVKKEIEWACKNQFNHRHMEMIPFETYRQNLVGIKGVYRQEVRDHIRSNL